MPFILLKIYSKIIGEDYPDVLKKVKYSSMSWMHNNKGFFYGVLDTFNFLVTGSI